jgi:hypothetical protein
VTGSPGGLLGGSRRGPRAAEHLQEIGLVGVLLMVISVPLSEMYLTWADRQAMKVAWNIVGPACPVATLSLLKAGTRPLKVFEYGGVSFARKSGHVSCVAMAEGGVLDPSLYRVCQFSSPGRIGVTTAGQTVVFAPGVGHRATVTVRDGVASCVIGGWFAH